ncbi:RNA polymerase subunit sigma [Suicoccus acidiformans]|uniref:RNA polymerase sigma factor SigI n=1 Tax=Suicoccus acidiformans TaxID=2036206 RepID=A0A347WJL1_9LACT|nr:sigma-70 family RNA polymerase sigma factor [Suicoccus acidiformans]AXY25268.1 RNA polymerase subunit sigma [Suicoccus acidiformans]
MGGIHIDQDINQLIEEHYGFIIQVVSETTNRYVNVKSDDTFSIALLAFEEAVEKYEEDKGAFLAFVRLVIRSRVIDYLRKEQRNQHQSLESMSEDGVQFEDSRQKSDTNLKFEIEDWKQDIASFNISLEQLVDESPKHQDSRERAIRISERSSKHPPITKPLFEKKRLPIKLTATYNNVTEKVIKGNKIFIISVIVIFKKGYSSLVDWIKGG